MPGAPAILAALALLQPNSAAVPAPAGAVPGDRLVGHISDWGHELRQERLPAWNPRNAPPVPPARWTRIIDAILGRAGRDGLWFSGYAALPFDIPLHPREPIGWRTPARFARHHRLTGLSWDVNLEARAAVNALRSGARVIDAREAAPTRRVSLLDAGYRRAADAEIRRLVPRYRDLPYVNVYTGTDEPIVLLPFGAAARTPAAQGMRREMIARFGWPPPAAAAAPTRSVREGLRWLAYSRFVGERFFAMKRRQAALIHRLDPDAVVSPNDFGFLDGFMPWDYTALAGFADIVEADPYASLLERSAPGRGRYNHGFGAKFLSDLTGQPVRIVVQAFPYAGYRPVPDDLDTWTAQALRAGASHIAFYARHNPRFTDPPFYDRMRSVARRLRGTRLPSPPTDPRTVVVYATMSEGQARPHAVGQARYRTRADGLYTTYATLGELAHGAFSFDADTRLADQPARLASARLVWLPRGEILTRRFAQRLAEWVRRGGTLVVTDPDAFARAPTGASLRDIRAGLVGAPLGPVRSEQRVTVAAGALGPGLPAADITLILRSAVRRSFTSLPTGTDVAGRFTDGAPAIIRRSVGAGRVFAFATDPMVPGALRDPAGLVALVAALQRSGGGSLGHPAWSYRIPGTENPGHTPWPAVSVSFAAEDDPHAGVPASPVRP